MLRVYKYNLNWDKNDECTLMLPKGAKLLVADLDPGRPIEATALGLYWIRIWAVIDDATTEVQERKFRVCGTGHSLPYDRSQLQYLQSVNDRPYIWHVFEILPIQPITDH